MSEPTPPSPERIPVDLLLGLLPEAEREEAMRRIAADPTSATELRLLSARWERARSRRASAEHAPALRRVRGRIWAALLVPVAAAAVIPWLLFGRQAAPSSAVVPLPTNLEALALRSSDPSDGSLERALSAYAEGRWAEAASRLADAPDGRAPFRALYRASALALSNRPEEALAILDTLSLGSMPDPWRSEGGWTRAVCLEEAGRHEEARESMSTLATTGPTEIRRRAEEWLARE
ncbi:MAG: hypothetical protein KC591_13475 [Gemmatimonadetes bacterium]|nr:hypothetical protein [Gemmatimonadota bacterium]